MPSAVVVSDTSVAHELGHLEPWLEDNDFAVVRVYREHGASWPDADLVIALGSPSSVAGAQVPDSHRAEIEQVASLVSRGRPYLGICFGAQVLSRATGGEVSPLPRPFAGYTTLQTRSMDTMIGPWTLWHNDGITAPSSADVVAALDHADLAFRIQRAWGLQPHIEVTPDVLTRMAIGLHAAPLHYEPLVDDLRRDTTNAARARALLDSFAAATLGSAGSAT